MTFYQLLTIFCITALSFFPVQIDMLIAYIIYGFAIFLLPAFVRNVMQDLLRLNPPTIFFIAFLIFAFLSTIFSIDQKHSIIQFILFVSYFVVFIGIRFIFSTLRSKELLAFSFLLLTSILSAISLYQTFILKYVNRESGGVSFMWVYYGHNHLSSLLVFTIPLGIYFLKKYWNKKSGHVLLFITSFLLLSLFLTFSRASLLSLISACAFGIFIFHFIPKQKIPLFFMISSLVLLLSFITPGAKQASVAKYDILSPARPVYWKTAIANGLSHPITGTGLDTFRHLSYDTPSRVLKTDYAHNFFLQMLSDAGIFGFLASISLIASVLWNALKKISKRPTTNDQRLLHIALFVGLLASTINAMVDFDWQLPTVFLTYWIIAGLF